MRLDSALLFVGRERSLNRLVDLLLADRARGVLLDPVVQAVAVVGVRA